MLKKIEDGSSWPNPQLEEFNDLAWRMRHAKETITQVDLHHAASVLGAYSMLITHPAMTLAKVSKKISMIRKAISGK